jgi:hypothetical protein
MAYDLIDSIGRQLNISRTADSEWICQSVYCVAGQMALASLWDHTEDNSAISIKHFKKRMIQVFEAYEDIYPQISPFFPKDKSVLLEEIYSIYLRTGFLYHSAYQIAPAIQAQATYGDLTLFRNPSPDARLYMSGLGFYYPVATSKDTTNVSDVFGLQTQTFESYLDELISFNDWEPVEWPENAEFLRLTPPFSRGYWQQMPDRFESVSMVRYGEPNKLYAFYRFHNGRFQQKPIPEWRLRDWFSGSPGNYGEYRRIAIALLKYYKTLPAVKVTTVGKLKEIKVGYRFPPSEEEFYKLYSWPVRYDFSSNLPQVFNRKMAIQVYPIFKHTMETLGYTFLEE